MVAVLASMTVGKKADMMDGCWVGKRAAWKVEQKVERLEYCTVAWMDGL